MKLSVHIRKGKLRVKLYSRWKWNNRMAIVMWISLFLAFGPIYWILFDTTFNSDFLGNDPFAYSMVQGLFIATFTITIVSLTHILMRRRGIVD